MNVWAPHFLGGRWLFLGKMLFRGMSFIVGRRGQDEETVRDDTLSSVQGCLMEVYLGS